MLDQVTKNCGDIPVAVFEDCGQTDDTEEYLVRGGRFVRRDIELECDVYAKAFNGKEVEIFLGHSNAGVAGNSNRAIKWFMDHTKADHLCLCNDDLIVKGPFHRRYAVAHEKLKVGMFCFCDFPQEMYRWATVKSNGISVKLLTRMTGIMMSITRDLVTRIGYYDAFLFTFGQEHCDYTNRARYCGFVSLNGVAQHCLDIECPELTHQEVNSSLTDAEKTKLNADGDAMIEIAGSRYASSDMCRPFGLGRSSKIAGGRDGAGIQVLNLRRYTKVREPRTNQNVCPISLQPVGRSIDLGLDVSERPAESFDSEASTF